MAGLELCHMLSVSLPVGGKSPLLNGVDNEATSISANTGVVIPLT